MDQSLKTHGFTSLPCNCSPNTSFLASMMGQQLSFSHNLSCSSGQWGPVWLPLNFLPGLEPTWLTVTQCCVWWRKLLFKRSQCCRELSAPVALTECNSLPFSSLVLWYGSHRLSLRCLCSLVLCSGDRVELDWLARPTLQTLMTQCDR